MPRHRAIARPPGGSCDRTFGIFTRRNVEYLEPLPIKEDTVATLRVQGLTAYAIVDLNGTVVGLFLIALLVLG